MQCTPYRDKLLCLQLGPPEKRSYGAVNEKHIFGIAELKTQRSRFQNGIIAAFKCL